MKTKFFKILLLIIALIANGLLFAIPYLSDTFLFLLFVAFVPLFLITEKLRSVKGKLLYVFGCILVWHFISLSWFFHDNIPLWSSILAISLSSLIIFLPFIVYFCIVDIGYYLGNIPFIIQWYQYTGVLGGTVWILFINIVILYLLDSSCSAKRKIVYSAIAVIPLLLSICLYLVPITTNRSEKIVVLNVADDKPYAKNELFQEVISQLASHIDSSVFLAVCPESICYLPHTSFPVNTYFSAIKRIFKRQAPRANVIFGGTTQDVKGEVAFSDRAIYNIAMCCDTSGMFAFRNKTRLVPFGEFVPYRFLFGKIPFVDTIVPNPILYKDEYDVDFKVDDMYILPLICYELYFSNLIVKHTKNKNIGLLVAISNDYILQKPVYSLQPIRMSRVQAVTFDKSVVKSATHGVSLIISPKGKTLALSKFNTSEIISAEVSINETHTLYTVCGNFIAYIFLFILFILTLFVTYYEKKNTISNHPS